MTKNTPYHSENSLEEVCARTRGQRPNIFPFISHAKNVDVCVLHGGCL